MGGYGGYYGGHGLVYGKRSADAEPKADADPWLTYGRYYGHGLGHYEDTVLVLAMVDTMAATDWSMARGLLMLSPRLMLIPTFCIVVWDTMDTVVWDTMDTVLVLAMVDTMAASDWSTARGLLMLSPRLMLIPTFSMEDMEDITDLAMPVMVDMGLDTEDT